MFDWRAIETPGQRAISSNFWVYWVVAVPLTILVIVGWRVWWNWEKQNYQRELGHEVDSVDKPDWLSRVAKARE